MLRFACASPVLRHSASAWRLLPLLAAGLCADLVMAAAPAASATAPGASGAPVAALTQQVGSAAASALSLKPEQVKALGVTTTTLGSAGAAAATAYPARLSVPHGQQRVVSAPLAGLVDSVLVSVGDVVRAGQPLASLRSAAAQELSRDAQQAASQADLAQRALQRDEQLHAEGLIPTSRLEASRAAQRQAGLLAAERQRLLLQSGARGDFSGSNDIALSSPVAGVVLEATVAVGQRVDAAMALFRVAQLGILWAEVQVPVADVGGVKPGDAVHIVLGGTETVTSGRVLSLGQAVDPATQTVTVRAEIKAGGAAAQRLRPGQVVEARISQRAAGVAQVAAAAVVRKADGAAVFIEQAPGQFRLAPVSVKSSSGGLTAVSGLAPGAKVVVQGTAALLALAKP
jgi:RND family efflux transporter MFP subunit